MLCIDVGNSHIFGGVFQKTELRLRFRYQSSASTSDSLGVFLRQVLRENGIEPGEINEIAVCSVVPNLDYSLRAACVKYFDLEPFFLQSGIKTGLKIHYRNPIEVGADRIANAMASVARFPNQHLIVVDFGTANTFCAISANKTYLGGAIFPGLRLGVTSLQQHAAMLPAVEILKPHAPVGRSTVESIQSGLFYAAIGGCRELLTQFKRHAFGGEDCYVIATGGFANLFDETDLFDVNLPDLVLEGLQIAYELNRPVV